MLRGWLRTGWKAWSGVRLAFLANKCRARLLPRLSRFPDALPQQLFEAQRVVGRVSRLIVVEIDVHRREPPRPLLDALGPTLELRIGVAALVLSRRRPVQPRVSKVGGDLELGVESGE